jgi:hypothetical protein
MQLRKHYPVSTKHEVLEEMRLKCGREALSQWLTVLRRKIRRKKGQSAHNRIAAKKSKNVENAESNEENDVSGNEVEDDASDNEVEDDASENEKENNDAEEEDEDSEVEETDDGSD